MYSTFTLASTTPRACDSLTLSASSGQPMDRITVSGLPPELANIAVYLETVAGGVGTLYPAGSVAGGQANFMVPVSPDGDPDGGDVMLTVTDAGVSCPAVPFTIDPLPPAAADYATYVGDLSDTLRTFLDLVAQVFGTDYASLSALAAPPADGRLPAYLAVRVFDAALKSPPEPETAAEGELLARLLTRADALGTLQDAVTGLTDWLAANGSLKAAAGPSQKAGAPARPAKALLATGGCLQVEPPSIDIPSTEQLSTIMNNPAMGQIAEGLGDFNTAMSGMAALTGVAGLSTTTSYLGALSTAVGTVVEFAIAASPSAFTSLAFDVESPIWEDKSAPESAWSNAQAYVTSVPFNASREVLENLLATAELAGLPGWALTVLQFSYQDTVDEVLDDLTAQDSPLCASVPAQEWGPFDVTSSDWSTSEVLGDTIAKRTHETYVPAMLGASEIRVHTRADKFGGATTTANNFVTVEAKTVTISPVSPKVDKPGDPVSLTVSVNAHFPEAVDFTPPAGVTPESVTHTYQGGGIHTFAFNSPGSENLFPAPFRVVSTSPVLPPTDFARADSVNIVLNSGTLEITGQRGCITPGETVELTAVLTGFTSPETKTVTWTQSAGTTTPGTDTRQATYQAPPTLGTVTVRAETPVPGSDQPAADEVQMDVSDSCLQQFFAVYQQSHADGDPDCEGPYGSRADIGEEAFDVSVYPPGFTTTDFFLESRTPVPFGPYFSGSPRTLTTQSSFVESIPVGLNTCVTTMPYSRVDVSLESTATSGHWEAHYEDRGTCYEVGTVTGCNVGRTTVFVDHDLYLPIQEAGTYQLTMDLSCTLIPNFGGVYLTLSRYIDGEGIPQPPNASEAPAIARNTVLDFACDSGTISRSLTLDLVGPLGTTGTDLLTIDYQGAPAGYLGGLTPEQIAENQAALDALGKGPAPQFLFDMVVDVRLERMN